MLALSIRQPWAWLIVSGAKDVENRTWATRHRGPFLVHASQRLDKAAFDTLGESARIEMPDVSQLPTGGIVGVADLLDCVTSSTSPWFNGPFGFVIGAAHPLPFVALRGRLGFFDAGENPEWRAAAQELTDKPWT